MPPLRIVLYANVIISALIRPNSTPGRILRVGIKGTTVRLITSHSLLLELEATLEYPRLARHLKMSRQETREFVILLEQVADPVNISDYPAPGICRDPDDEPYLRTALAGRADYIVSGEGDLLDLKTFGYIPILTPADFEKLLNKIKGRH